MQRDRRTLQLFPQRDRTLIDAHVVIGGVHRLVLVRWLFDDVYSVRPRGTGPVGVHIPILDQKLTLHDLAELEREGLTVV